MRLIPGCAFALAMAATVPASAEPSRIDALFDLSTPESAVEAYVDAFADDDFIAVYLLLDPQAHEVFMRALQMFRLEFITRLGPYELNQDNRSGLPVEYAADPEKPGMGPDILQMFDYYMTLVDREDGQLIDLDGGGGLFGSAVTIMPPAHLFNVNGRMRAWVDTEVAGEGPVKFVLQLSPGGRWRVLSIIAREGTDDEVVFLPVRE